MIDKSDILFKDNDLIAINKPPGLLVHRTSIAEENEKFAMQMVRNLLNQTVFPIHRIDRPTSGVLLFALNKYAAYEMNTMFTEKKVDKYYTAIVRGWLSKEPLILNHPVKSEKGKLQDAETKFRLLEHLEFPIPVRPYETSRYSIIEAIPLSGRWHQIRQHLAHLRHYIINDRVHGDGHHNRMFTNQLGISNLLLHATEISFVHPINKENITIKAGFPQHWEKFEQIRNNYSKSE